MVVVQEIEDTTYEKNTHDDITMANVVDHVRYNGQC